ncbi:SDR family NAD(P)-dependent oxidoreductase [Streptomyces hoynatensis]|uniref:Probable oxidoreductase n=1 Tax=Streptomyces hoynatensis TaxID=1141874 RepID=A0A3A9YML6_9ACTN|nr:SDR family NAD(P)-dependent oxidoreductase [Streptomyces hoynatensis]RKN37400.1 SDR family NAD(P)-dependent oxidoreductase [Streptomyces hoynatensis]
MTLSSSRSPVPVPLGFATTAAEVAREVDLSGRRAVVTGGSSGIGRETARALAGAGAEVTLAVRDTGAGRRAAEDIAASTGNEAVLVAPLDLSSPSSVSAFTNTWSGPLHILVGNAGVMATPRARTPQGWELQFATNHLGHFALTAGLHRPLAAAGGARIVCVSSSAHLLSPVVFDDLSFRFRPYDPQLAYAQSKTANVLFAVEATRRWAEQGITANAVNPGAVPTRLQRHVGDRMSTPPERRKTPQQGAATSTLLAVWPPLAGVGGRYFEDCAEAPTVDHRTADFHGVAGYALDPVNAERLWEESLRLLAAA